MGYQLQGLLLPPESMGWLAMLGIGIISVAIVGLFWYWWSRRGGPSVIAQQQLQQLQVSMQSKSIAAQAVGLSIAQILRDGLLVTRLDAYQPSDIQAWKIFLAQLNQLCYDKNKADISLELLLSEALSWLDQSSLKVQDDG